MFAALASVLLFAPADPPKELPEAARKELKKFEGKWKATKETVSEGSRVPEMNGGEVVVEFKGRMVLVGGAEWGEVTAVDPSTDPKCIDIKFLKPSGEVQKGQSCECVYKLDGDTLTMAVHFGAGKKRPADLAGPKEAGTVVVELKRVKP